MHKWHQDAKIDHIRNSEATCVEELAVPLQTNHLDLQLLDDRLINAKQTDPNELFDKTDEKVNKPGKIN